MICGKGESEETEKRSRKEEGRGRKPEQERQTAVGPGMKWRKSKTQEGLTQRIEIGRVKGTDEK